MDGPHLPGRRGGVLRHARDDGMSIICGSAATSLAEEDGLLAATGLGGANARSTPAAGAVHGGS